VVRTNRRFRKGKAKRLPLFYLYAARVRAMVWKQGKRGTTRYRELRKRGIAAQEAAQTAGSSDGPWHLANSPAVKLARLLCRTLSSPRSGFPSSRLTVGLTRRTAGCGPACPVVWQGKRGDSLPYADSGSFLSCSCQFCSEQSATQLATGEQKPGTGERRPKTEN
jgi:RNA-directed DNA polymerase